MHNQILCHGIPSVKSGTRYICPMDFLLEHAGTGKVKDIATSPNQLIFENGFCLPVLDIYLLEKDTLQLDFAVVGDPREGTLGVLDVLENSTIIAVLLNDKKDDKNYMVILNRGAKNPAAVAVVHPDVFRESEEVS